MPEEFSDESDGDARVIALQAGRATLEIINPAHRPLCSHHTTSTRNSCRGTALAVLGSTGLLAGALTAIVGGLGLAWHPIPAAEPFGEGESPRL